jgi:DNA-binding NtrC family response regulator
VTANSDKSRPLVLVVDDTPSNLNALLPTLETAGFDVLIATGGEQALQRARLGAPELVLLDVVMPGMDGFETCRRLKADAQLRDIPVIFMTALDDTAEKVAAFEAGGVDYVTKPFDNVEMLQRVRAHVTLRRLQRTLQQRNHLLERTTALLQAITEAMTGFMQSGDLAQASAVLLACALRHAQRDRGVIGLRFNGGLRVLAAQGPPPDDQTLRECLAASNCGDATTVGGWFGHDITQGSEPVGWLGWPAAAGSPIELQAEDRRAIDQLLRSAGVLYSFELLKQREAESQRRRQAAEDTVSVLAEEIGAHHQTDRIIGESEVLRSVLAQVERVAATAGTVLILGETGTGKELFARAIHQLSPRHARPLIRINCAAIPENLVESELFGHERGAFTGAAVQRKGRIELADHGTLFLDEIGDMPLAAQVKLLRVLQEQEFERVGGSTTIRVDLRVIAATHRDLRQLAAEGRFREDLYYRLNVVPIEVPALRERREDIATLALFFVNRFNTRHGRNVERILQSSLDRLAGYRWPGNVRELENVVERAVILSRGPVLDLSDVPLPVHSADASPDSAVAENGRAPAAFSGTVNDLQHDYILHVLESTGWVIEGESGAAARLGLKPSTLRNRMNRLGIHKVSRARAEG